MFYIYICKECAEEIEIAHSIKESPEILCPKDGLPMVRLITGGTGTIFRGMGWATKGSATSSKPEHSYIHEAKVPVFEKGYKPE